MHLTFKATPYILIIFENKIVQTEAEISRHSPLVLETLL